MCRKSGARALAYSCRRWRPEHQRISQSVSVVSGHAAGSDMSPSHTIGTQLVRV